VLKKRVLVKMGHIVLMAHFLMFGNGIFVFARSHFMPGKGILDYQIVFQQISELFILNLDLLRSLKLPFSPFTKFYLYAAFKSQ